jgi:hypothetical protein
MRDRGTSDGQGRRTRRALTLGLLAAGLTALPIRTGSAQSINGTTGLVTVPTGGLLNDGEVLIGANVLDREYNVRSGAHDQHRYFVTMGFLPFLEVSVRLTRNAMMRLDDHAMEWPGDRGASARLRLFREQGIRPAVVVGVHDFMTAFSATKDETVWFNALYVAGSKTFKPDRLPVSFGLHAGYGSDRMKAKHHEFAGLFGGVSADVGRHATVMLEYDAEKVNGGVRLVLLRRVRILLALLNMDSFAGGVGFAFNL